MAVTTGPYKLNPYIEVGNETFADPRLTFVAAGVLAATVAKRKLGEREVTIESLRPMPDEQEEVAEALELLVSLGYFLKR